MIAPLCLLLRPVNIFMQPAGRCFALDVIVLDETNKEVGSVRRGSSTSNIAHIPAFHVNAIVVAARDGVAWIPFHIDAEIKRSESRHCLYQGLGDFCRADGQSHLDGLGACVSVGRADRHVLGPRSRCPFRLQCRLHDIGRGVRSIRLEVVC